MLPTRSVINEGVSQGAGGRDEPNSMYRADGLATVPGHLYSFHRFLSLAASIWFLEGGAFVYRVCVCVHLRCLVTSAKSFIKKSDGWENAVSKFVRSS